MNKEINEWYNENWNLDEGARTTHYRPATMYASNGDPGDPEEWEGEITSDISGKIINDWDNIWKTPDDELCTPEEVVDLVNKFNKRIITKNSNPNEYREIVTNMVNSGDYAEEDFIDNPTLVIFKDADTELDYISEDTPDDILDIAEELGYEKVDYTDLDFDESLEESKKKKKKRKHKKSNSLGMFFFGNPAGGIDFFNRHMGTDFPDEKKEETDAEKAAEKAAEEASDNIGASEAIGGSNSSISSDLSGDASSESTGSDAGAGEASGGEAAGGMSESAKLKAAEELIESWWQDIYR